ncbi:TetR family transcriptional regulator [Sphingomonas sp. DBB INV C78]|uniref:TetR/AcrR family transcriptional regulator n=1 Tax=Sphingomonas sp. DBB INV C78 TaxID=3349434 RepID=UPI0036D20E49
MSRPIAYDREAVIERATFQFWEHGFADCDVDTLTRSAGVNRHSLYKAFGGKAGLFTDALTFYIAHIAAPYIALIEKGDGLDAIIAYFEAATGAANDAVVQGYDLRGCFITNTVAELGRSDPQVAAIIDGYYARMERAFAALIERGQAGGSIRADLDPVATARWLLLTTQGISVSARMGAPAPDFPGVVRAALAPQSA